MAKGQGSAPNIHLSIVKHLHRAQCVGNPSIMVKVKRSSHNKVKGSMMYLKATIIRGELNLANLARDFVQLA